MYIALVLTICAAVKTLAVLECAPLYRLFLFLPAVILSFFQGAEYSEQAGIYTFPGLILDYSCSGIHFFMITLIATTLTPAPLSILWRGGSILSAFAATLIVNTMRIGLAVKLAPFASGRPWLHEAVGTLVFFSGLIAYYYSIQLIAVTIRKQNAKQIQTA